MSVEDKDDFLSAMDDVRPIFVEKRELLKQTPLDKATIAVRRESAIANQSRSTDPLADGEVVQLEPGAILEYRKAGVQHGVYKSLRLGRYAIDARLDLHRLSVEQARQQVYQFVSDCIANDIRCALITHGKGEGRKTPAVIKSHIAHWLPQIDAVLAFYSSQPRHGGAGACYVLLKKSEKLRRENLEKHQRR
jgi:DNA-nicking Smr family endonuclease